MSAVHMRHALTWVARDHDDRVPNNIHNTVVAAGAVFLIFGRGLELEAVLVLGVAFVGLVFALRHGAQVYERAVREEVPRWEIGTTKPVGLSTLDGEEVRHERDTCHERRSGRVSGGGPAPAIDLLRHRGGKSGAKS